MKKERLDKWKELYYDAITKRKELDNLIQQREDLYNGKPIKIEETPSRKAKISYCKRNMTFELIESQINNATPQPKVTPRDPANVELANQLEGYLRMSMDRISSEALDDEFERGVLKQGTGFYLVYWDETITTPTTRGDISIKHYPLINVYPQPGIKNIKDAEYIFTKDLVSVKKIKKLYNVDIPEGSDFKGMNTLITAWYLNDDGYLSRLGWIEFTDTVVFDDEDFELRRILVCKDCGEPIIEEDKCPLCGSKNFKFEFREYETLTEDVLKFNSENPKDAIKLADKDSEVPFYKIRVLPFVLRKNISDDTSLYGKSDIDLLAENQKSLNKILTKMEENVLKAGSFVTKPAGVNIPNDDETLKVVTLKDPNQIKAFGVFNVQANMQQDNILQDEFYQMSREAVGITDSFQGKRDNTAESGKAKQISAAQASGRLESKRRMKNSAYGDLYELMFKFLLAYCDEKRIYALSQPDGSYTEGSFSRYNYLDGEKGNVYYNDRFLFSVDSASTLASNREAMWQETTANFQAGTFGNPTDMNSIILYWNVMRGLGYPLANQAVTSLKQRIQELPMEMQQAIMQNPDILKAVQKVLQEGGSSNENSK